MNGLNNLPTVTELKQEAKKLRCVMEAQGAKVSHSEALEAISHKYGFKNWNILRARAAVYQTLSLNEGDTVDGRYLGQAFSATVLECHEWNQGRYRIKLDLKEAVDVVRFDSFSAFRKRINAEIGVNGKSFAVTSDNIPHLELAL